MIAVPVAAIATTCMEGDLGQHNHASGYSIGRRDEGKKKGPVPLLFGD